jgi:hypothetical protein
MAHYKPVTYVSTFGLRVRLRRQRRSSRPMLTKTGRYYNFDLPNPNPDGASPTTAWVLHSYPNERRGRQRRAEEKRRERRAILRHERQEALRAAFLDE